MKVFTKCSRVLEISNNNGRLQLPSKTGQILIRARCENNFSGCNKQLLSRTICPRTHKQDILDLTLMCRTRLKRYLLWLLLYLHTIFQQKGISKKKKPKTKPSDVDTTVKRGNYMSEVVGRKLKGTAKKI